MDEQMTIDAILIRLYGIQRKTVTTESFLYKSNIPKDHLEKVRSLMVKDGLIRKSKDLEITQKGIQRVENMELGVSFSDNTLKNNSSFEMEDKSDGKKIIISGNRVTNKSKIDFKTSEDVTISENEVTNQSKIKAEIGSKITDEDETKPTRIWQKRNFWSGIVIAIIGLLVTYLINKDLI